MSTSMRSKILIIEFNCCRSWLDCCYCNWPQVPESLLSMTEKSSSIDPDWVQVIKLSGKLLKSSQAILPCNCQLRWEYFSLGSGSLCWAGPWDMLQTCPLQSRPLPQYWPSPHPAGHQLQQGARKKTLAPTERWRYGIVWSSSMGLNSEI